MFNYKATIMYDGFSYYGFQKQGNLKTIELELEKAFLVYDFKPKIYASGRTDKKVHALGQVISFKLEYDINPLKVKKFLNRVLPLDIKVIDCTKVSDSFHARYSTKAKEYFYLFSKHELTPFNSRYTIYYKDLDFDTLKKAALLFKGKHDFTAFTKNENSKSKVREIFDIYFIEDDNYFKIYFKGDGFLKYQIRKMVGLLINIGLFKKDISLVKTMLDTLDPTLNSFVADANALYLNSVFY